MDVGSKVSIEISASPLFNKYNHRLSQSTAHTIDSCVQQGSPCSLLFQQLDRKCQSIVPSVKLVDKASEITPKMSLKLMDWIMNLCWNYNFSNQTLFLAVQLCRRHIRLSSVSKKQLQAVGLTSLYIATKYHQTNKLRLKEFLQMCKNIYTFDDVIQIQKQMLENVQFDLEIPTLLQYMHTYLQKNELDKDQHNKLAFWIEIAHLKGMEGSVKQQFNLIIGYVKKETNQIILLEFARKLEHKTIFHKHLSKFDVGAYLS